MMEYRLKKGYTGALVGIFGNLGIFLVKLYIATLTNSVSIMSDAFHTLSDLSTSIAVMVGFYLSSRVDRKNYPFGLGRAEYLASFVVAIILIFAGVDMLIESYERFIHPVAVDVGFLMIFVLVLTIVTKEAMAIFAWKIAKNIDSLSLEADAWHHHTDALSTVAVIIAVVLADYGYQYADTVVGGGIAILLIYIGSKIAWKSGENIVGKSRKDMSKIIVNIASRIEGVLNVHNVVVHDYGNMFYITLHIYLGSNITLNHAHEIASKVELEIKKEIPNSHVVIHMEPLSSSMHEPSVYCYDNS